MPARAPTRGRRSRARRSGPEPLRIRWGGLGDLALLVEHRHRMWREIRRFRPGELDRHDADYRRWVRGQFARGRFHAVIVEAADGTPAGSGALWRMPWIPRPGPLGRGELPYILSMYTAPRFRGRGVATRIVAAMCEWARAHGYPRIVLHASRFGRPLYVQLGFEAGSEMRLRLGVRRPRRAPGGGAGARRLSRPSRTP